MSMAGKINVPKLLREFEAIGLFNVWVDGSGGMTSENATPEQLVLAQRLINAHDPEPEPTEKRKEERAVAPELSPDNTRALVLELAAWAKAQGYTSPLLERMLAKEAEIITKHPEKSDAIDSKFEPVG
jgi:hypothetical protein